jgi:hypothetical protein
MAKVRNCKLAGWRQVTAKELGLRATQNLLVIYTGYLTENK